MKTIVLFPACLLLALSCYAQSVNTLMFGTNILYSGANCFKGKPVYEQSLQNKIGFFAGNNLAFGLNLEAGINGNKTVPYGITFFSRWYVPNQLRQMIRLFVEAGAGIADNTSNKGELLLPDQNWMRPAICFSPGINIYPGRTVSLELAPEYRYIGGEHKLHRLGLSAGVRIFLSEERFKQTFPHKFRSSF